MKVVLLIAFTFLLSVVAAFSVGDYLPKNLRCLFGEPCTNGFCSRTQHTCICPRDEGFPPNAAENAFQSCEAAKVPYEGGCSFTKSCATIGAYCDRNSETCICRNEMDFFPDSQYGACLRRDGREYKCFWYSPVNDTCQTGEPCLYGRCNADDLCYCPGSDNGYYYDINGTGYGCFGGFVSYHGPCTFNETCRTVGAYCDLETNKCECPWPNIKFVPNRRYGICSEPAGKQNYGDTCFETSDCGTYIGSKCNNGTCECDDKSKMFYSDDRIPACRFGDVPYQGNCTDWRQCSNQSEFGWMRCVDGRCSCPLGFVHYMDENGGHCDEPKNCSDNALPAQALVLVPNE